MWPVEEHGTERLSESKLSGDLPGERRDEEVLPGKGDQDSLGGSRAELPCLY